MLQRTLFLLIDNGKASGSAEKTRQSLTILLETTWFWISIPHNVNVGLLTLSGCTWWDSYVAAFVSGGRNDELQAPPVGFVGQLLAKVKNSG